MTRPAQPGPEVPWQQQQGAEFAAKVAAGDDSALIPTCDSLRDSIEDAVTAGRVEILPP